MGATSAADSKETAITAAASAATIAILVICLALGLWRWAEAREKKQREAIDNGAVLPPRWDVRFLSRFPSRQFKGNQQPWQTTDIEMQAPDAAQIPGIRTSTLTPGLPVPTLAETQLRPPVPALIRTPATGSFSDVVRLGSAGVM